jgi:AcrR family transcriptional regulator
MAFEPQTDTRSRILAEAEHCFAVEGYDGVSMRQIAEAAGVTKANIYYYFRDKESLYLEVLQADMEAFIGALTVAAAVPGTCRQRVASVADAFSHIMRDKTSIIQLTLRQFGGLEPELRGLVNRYREELILPIAGLLAEGVRSGELRALDPALAAFSFLGMLSIFQASYLLDIPLHRPVAEALDEAVALFFDGAAATTGGCATHSAGAALPWVTR